MASFWFSAALRIHGAPHLHPEIIATLGHGDECHKKGDAVPDRPGKKWPNDIWLLSSEVPEMQDISDHLRWIVDFFSPSRPTSSAGPPRAQPPTSTCPIAATRTTADSAFRPTSSPSSPA